jgi:hypothetical protein
MRGLDPRIHHLCEGMDCRVKPGNDELVAKQLIKLTYPPR